MFKKDGSVHYEGIKNEDVTIQILNEFEIYKDKVEKRGGTRKKEDAVSGTKKLSIKKKEGIMNGSFDWSNLGNCGDIIGDHFKPYIEKLKELRALPEIKELYGLDKKIRDKNKIVIQSRKEFNDLSEDRLSSLTSEDIKTILQRGTKDVLSGFDIVINDTKDRKIFIFPFENHPIIEYINLNYTPSLVKGRGKSSQKVVFSDGINYYDCGIRIRLVSNNGVTAFLGLSEANSNSSIGFKIQQDNIKNLLSVTKHKQYDY